MKRPGSDLPVVSSWGRANRRYTRQGAPAALPRVAASFAYTRYWASVDRFSPPGARAVGRLEPLLEAAGCDREALSFTLKAFGDCARPVAS